MFALFFVVACGGGGSGGKNGGSVPPVTLSPERVTFSGLQGGILLSQFEPASSAQTFKIYKSQVSLP